MVENQRKSIAGRSAAPDRNRNLTATLMTHCPRRSSPEAYRHAVRAHPDQRRQAPNTALLTGRIPRKHPTPPIKFIFVAESWCFKLLSVVQELILCLY